MSKKTIILTISGPSLTGKSVFSDFLGAFNFKEIVSETTRPIRAGEVPGKTYNYITHEEFHAKVQRGEMLQHNPVDANFYGISYDSYKNIAEQGSNAFLVVAPAGAKQIREFCDKNDILCHQIFIDNSLDLRLNRFLDRFANDNKGDSKTYAKRLINMINVEQPDWVDRAIEGKDKYDQIFPNFDKDTQNQVLSELLKAIEVKLDDAQYAKKTMTVSKTVKKGM